jgi:hypothetical protein
MRYVLFILVMIKCTGSLAQATVDVSLTMPSVALVDILPTGSTNFNLQMTAPTEAGNTIGTGTSNAANWLIFTSAVASGASRAIKGDIVGTMPPGIRLRLAISPYIGDGLGFTGGNSYITTNTYLTNTAVSFIDNIKGAYTGTGYGTHGFKLTYSLEIQSYGSIRSGTSNITIRYTMVDN